MKLIYQPIGKALLVAFAYIALGEISFMTASGGIYASAVWPSAGLAIAAILFWGYSGLCGVFIGASLTTWLLNHQDSSPIIWTLCSLIGVGACLQAWLSRWMIISACGWPNRLQRGRDVVLFFLLAGPIGCIINASVGSFSLLSLGFIEPIQFQHTWQIWWLGDVIGAVTLAPLLVIIGQKSIQPNRKYLVSICLIFNLGGF